jgi:predicted nucleic acid-binding protein
MIHLDTNALIAMPAWARARHPLVNRIREGEPAAVCTMVWYEFVCGPADALEVDLARQLIQGRILPIGPRDAELAAHLYNATGRRRGLRTDALIAASAINADAEFATLNAVDFKPFVEFGLRLAAA